MKNRPRVLTIEVEEELNRKIEMASRASLNASSTLLELSNVSEEKLQSDLLVIRKRSRYIE